MTDRKRISVTAILTVLACFGMTRAQAEDRGQTLSEIVWFETKADETGRVVWYAGQEETGGRLVLTPNEVYFSGRLRASGKGPDDVPSQELNQGKSFAGVGEWDTADDEMRWHLWLTRTGPIKVKALIEVTRDEADGEMSIELKGESTSSESHSANGESRSVVSVSRTRSRVSQLTVASGNPPAPQRASFEFDVGQTGFYTLTLRGKPAAEGRDVGRLIRLDLTGSAIKGARVLRSRWRPAAVHAGSFTNSEILEGDESSSIWVMETRPRLKEHSTYSPVTTPFGYFGSTFTPDGKIGGVNFSMWSYGRGKEEPPIERLSHLLAVGSRQARFSGFGHEGTGVKPRDWNPYEGLTVKRQVLALRVEWGSPYDTYYGYFLEPQTDEWRLYAVGRKFAKERPARLADAARHLWPGSFVEVPGPAEVQRTGDSVREIHFRGWTRAGDGPWRRFDSMAGPAKTKGLANKSWHVTPDGWFAMKMGGMAHYEYDGKSGPTRLPEEFRGEPLPDFLDDQKTKRLMDIPVRVTLSPVALVSPTSARIPFEVSGVGPGATAQLFWGGIDYLTMPGRWERSEDEAPVKSGRGELLLKGLSPGTDYFCRALVRDDAGQTWSFETGRFTTPAN